MKITRCILLICIILLQSAACKNTGNRINDTNSGIEITDAAGRKVKISESSKFMTTISQTEIFRILDAESQVEGVNRWVAQLNLEENPVLSKLPVIGGFSPGDVNYEMIYKIADDSPDEDVVLTYNQPWADNVEEKVGKSGKIKVIKLNLYGSSEPQKEIAILGKALGKEAECKRYIDWFDSLLYLVHIRVNDIPDESRVKIYWDASGKGHYDTSGDNTSADMIIARAGGVLLSGQLPQSSMSVSPEWIMQENPDVVLSHAANARHLTNIQFGYGAVGDTSGLFSAWNELVSTPGINSTNAVRKNRVYFISDDLMFGPSQPVGAVVLAKLFYPEKFEDIDTREMLKYYYERFMRLDYKGFYIYPTILKL